SPTAVESQTPVRLPRESRARAHPSRLGRRPALHLDRRRACRPRADEALFEPRVAELLHRSRPPRPARNIAALALPGRRQHLRPPGVAHGPGGGSLAPLARAAPTTGQVLCRARLARIQLSPALSLS